MTEYEAEAFVAEFARQRSAGRGEALWRADGKLHYPFADRVIEGHELGYLNDLSMQRAPDLTWELQGWTFRGDVIVVEWRCTNRQGDQTYAFSGVDKLTIRDGKILEEIVYADTAPLRAAISGQALEPIIRMPELQAA